jgi:hypothetical protein
MIKIRLKNRPWEIVEVHEHQLLDLQRWDMILEYVDDEEVLPEEHEDVEELIIDDEARYVMNESGEAERVLSFEELQEFFKSSPDD